MKVAALRSLLRIYRGLRPHPSDLDKIVAGLRNRQSRKKPTSTPGWINITSNSNPKKQSERLRRFQLRKLQNTVEYIYKYIPYYQEQMDYLGVKPSDIQSLENISKLPITRRSILQERQDDFISRKPGLSPIQIFKTSGTTGKPLLIYLNADELHYLITGRAIGLLLSGSQGPTTISQIHFPLDISMDAVLTTRAAQMAGSLMLNYGLSGTTEEHVKSLFKERNIPGKNKKVSTLFCSPAYLWTLTRKAEEMGMDFKQSELEWIFTGGATVTDKLKKQVKETWDVQLTEGYGMVETPFHGAGRCPEGHMHFLDFTGYIEVLDPKTKEPVHPGEEGVLVKTEFYPDIETMPLMRYWTQDLVKSSLEEACPCGNVSSYILDILGRADQMVFFGPQNYYPQEIGDSLLGIPGLVSPPHFHVAVSEDFEGQVVTVDIESFEHLSASDQEELQKIVYKKIAFAKDRSLQIGSVKMIVHIVPPDSIKEPFRYKHLGPDLSMLQQPFDATAKKT